jgi:aldehyde:ferredoxin oxidoreductase
MATKLSGFKDHVVRIDLSAGAVSYEGINDAGDLWGKDTHEVHKVLPERHPGRYVDVMVIGPAAENGVKYAGWINKDDRACGCGGTGTVGASKNLKAIPRSPWPSKAR